LFWADAKSGNTAWEFAVLVTSLDLEVLSLAQLYRDRADSENVFDAHSDDRDRRFRSIPTSHSDASRPPFGRDGGSCVTVASG